MTVHIPRYGNLWLMVAFIAAVAPHLGHLPLWVSIAAACAVAWRIQIYRGAWRRPGALVKTALALLALGGLFAVYSRLYGLDPMVALLVTGYALKLLEMKGRRDGLVVVFLGFFVAATYSLFNQSPVAAVYVLVAMVLVAAGLVGLHQSDLHRRHDRPLKTAAVIFAQAIPLMLILFIVLPRIGPLWAVPMQRDGGVTGMSDTMAPGDVSRLGRSGDTAFRVEFEGVIPPRRELYWRGLVLSRFEGRTWSQLETWGYGRAGVLWYRDKDRIDMPLRGEGEPRDYRVTLEATGSTWLYALAVPEPMSPNTGVTENFVLMNRLPVNTKMAYEVRSRPGQAMERGGLSPVRYLLETRLPDKGNLQTRQKAARWAAETDGPLALIERVLDLYRRDFVYTLSPPALGDDTVDEFLWQTRSGFCEHFASSFVFFMRAAGIPARVVMGYQGGEVNSSEQYLVVRQYDAHAWAEVWLEGRGWVRIDPTAAVAPERIEQSPMDVLSGDEGLLSDSPLSLERFRGVPLLNALRMRLDYMDYLWTRWVLDYQSRQWDLLSNLLGQGGALKMAFYFMVAGAVALLPVLLFLFRRPASPPLDPADRHYRAFCARLARAGLPRRRGEGARDFARRVATGRPGLAPEVNAITGLYEQVRYVEDRRLEADLARRIRAFRPGRC